jgi:hypothetical protein
MKALFQIRIHMDKPRFCDTHEVSWVAILVQKSVKNTKKLLEVEKDIYKKILLVLLGKSTYRGIL